MNSIRGHIHHATLFVAISLLPACAGTKVYPNNLAKNLEIRTTTKSDSMLLRVGASVHVHRVIGPCATEYLGTVELDRKTTPIGIPVGKPSYLEVVFANSGVLGGYQSATSEGMVLTPRHGYRYRIDASYVDSLYSVVISEMPPGSTRVKEIPAKRLSGC